MSLEASRIRRWSATLRRALDARLQATYLLSISIITLSVGGILLCVSFATSDRNQTAFGQPLGNDFAGFFVAAQILDHGQGSQLYNQALHYRFYHDLMPRLDPHDSIPYVHPPFVAGLFRPLTWLSYEVAVAVWLLVSLSLFMIGVLLLIGSPSGLLRDRLPLVMLLALSFEPFLLECWLGGQLSTIGFFSYALAWHCMSRNRPVSAGSALGLTLYKPTLLLLILPLLLIGRRWRVLLGIAAMGILLGCFSLAVAGWEVNASYLDVLISFRKSTSTGNLQLRSWKYVDLNNGLRLFWNGPPSVQMLTFAISACLPFGWLAVSWSRWERLTSSQRQWLWAAVLTWLPVLNIYVGIYDSIFVLQSVLLAADLLTRESRPSGLATGYGLAYWTLTLFLTAWFSQPLSRIIGIQVYTAILIGLGFFEFRVARLGKWQKAVSSTS